MNNNKPGESAVIIQDYRGAEDLCRAAAGLFMELATEAVKRKGYFTAALSGGSTPKDIYELLAGRPYGEKIPWSKTYIFWGDERFVPADSEENNSHMAFKALLNHVPIPPSNIFPIPTSLPPQQSAEAYEELLRRFIKEHPAPLDLVLLGLGENGHTASLFPNTSVLDEKKRWVKEVFVRELNMFRITMTAHFINQAENVAFIVSGENKAKVFSLVIGGTYDPVRLPAQLIKPTKGNLYWLVDKSVMIQ